MSVLSNMRKHATAGARAFSAFLRGVCQSIRRAYASHDGAYLLFCFTLPFLLMATIYAIMGVWPFGGSSVLVLDLNGQYVYFFEALRDFVYGDASILYSFSRSLGGEFMGMYAYYLASPLSYLVALFPKDGLLDALFLMLLLKTGFSGLSFGYFLKKTSAPSPVTAVIFSTIYAMTAYGVVMQHNTMWMDNVILLPLIALGIRALVTERRYKLYTVSLALAILSNFYIGYMTCIFSVLYFLYLHLSLTKEESNPLGEPLHFLRSGLRFGTFSLIGGAISTIIVIPAVYSLSFGKNSFSSPTYEFVSKLDIFDILTKFFIGSYDTVRPEGLPFIYCGIITLLLIPFYFLCRNITTREKGANLLLILILIFSFSIHVIDIMWHGGQAPNWLNYRYSYMLCFLLVGMAAKGFEAARTMSARWAIYAAIPPFLLLLLTEHFGYSHLDSIFFPVGINLLCLAIYVVALGLFIHRRDVPRRYASLCMLVLVAVEMLGGGLLNIIQLDMDVVISSRASYYGFKERWEDAANEAHEDAALPFYRMESLVHRYVNDPFLFQYRGVSGSTSTLNRDTIAFLNSMGYSSASHASCYTGTNPFTDSFLSISYVLGEATTVFPDSYERIYTNGDVVAYRNPDALPIAFGVAPTIHGITLRHYEYDKEGNRVNPDDTREVHIETSPFLRMNALASALLGEDIELFTPISHQYHGENVSHRSFSQQYDRLDTSRDSIVNFTAIAPFDTEIFAVFPTDVYNESEYLLNGERIGTYFGREKSGYLCLGTYEAGENCTVSFKLGGNGINVKNNVDYFYSMNRDVYNRLIATLSAGGYQVDSCSEDAFSGTITVKEGYETILTTIPYDKGWRITVDGKEIEGYETLDSLLCFDLPLGEHTLTLRYLPREYILAALLSLTGTLTLIGIIIGERIRRRVIPTKTENRKENHLCSTTSEEN